MKTQESWQSFLVNHIRINTNYCDGVRECWWNKTHFKYIRIYERNQFLTLQRIYIKVNLIWRINEWVFETVQRRITWTNSTGFSLDAAKTIELIRLKPRLTRARGKSKHLPIWLEVLSIGYIFALHLHYRRVELYMLDGYEFNVWVG